jgi:hypothetical protein
LPEESARWRDGINIGAFSHELLRSACSKREEQEGEVMETNGTGVRQNGAPWTRIALGTLLAFGALNALGGGWYGITGARGVPVEWLRGTPFTDYFVPSLILLVVVGGSFLSSAIAVLAGWRHAKLFAIGAACVVLGWLLVQVTLIGYESWMQPVTAIAGIGVLLLASRLRNPRSEEGQHA